MQPGECKSDFYIHPFVTIAAVAVPVIFAPNVF